MHLKYQKLPQVDRLSEKVLKRMESEIYLYYFASFFLYGFLIFLFLFLLFFFEKDYGKRNCALFNTFSNSSQNSTQMTPREISRKSHIAYKQTTLNNNVIIHQLLPITNETL